MNATAVTGIGVLLLLLAVLLRWKWRTCSKFAIACSPYSPSLQLVHRLCPHSNVVQRFEVEQKDSLDDHLDVLTRKLADKEGRLRLSKSKIMETQHEIDNLHAIDQNVRIKYREIMDSLKTDLLGNERECKKLQEQIEWVSRRRAELKDEVRQGQKLYGEAAAELATNLAELQRGRLDHYTTEKPYQQTMTSLRVRKESQLFCPNLGSSLNKSPTSSTATSRFATSSTI